MSLSSLMNVSRNALQSYQMAIDVTGGNIANINTPGYSRERAVLNSVGSVNMNTDNGQIGVNVASVERVYDEYLDNQIVGQTQVLGYNQKKSDVLSGIEGIFAENGSGASDLLSKFWNAWSALATNPKGQVERGNLLAAAEDMTSKFRQMDSNLTKAAQDAGDNITNIVTQVNDYISQIGDLNSKITTIADDKGEGNLLKDKRMDLVNKLSNYANINYITDSNGAVNIFLADGRPLVAGNNVFKLAVKTDQFNMFDDIVYQDNQNVSLKSALSQGNRGQLAALLEISDTIVPGYQAKLNAVASAIASEVNSKHQSGYDNYGNPGGVFFAPTTDAKNFQVSTTVSSDLNKIAASATINSDGDNASSIGAIKDTSVMNGGAATINDYYASFIGQCGRDIAGAKSSLDSQTAIMQQLSNRREATSGVALDEEMMNLMKYQMSYGAAGKMINTINQMMDVMMQIVR